VNSRAEFPTKMYLLCPETVSRNLPLPRNLPKSSLNLPNRHKKCNWAKKAKKAKFHLAFFQKEKKPKELKKANWQPWSGFTCQAFYPTSCRIVPTMPLLRNSTTVSLFLCRVRNGSQTVVRVQLVVHEGLQGGTPVGLPSVFLHKKTVFTVLRLVLLTGFCE